MIDEVVWDTKNVTTFEQETEETLLLENWMTSEMLWDCETNVEIETEQEMAIESWMTDENVWN